MFKLAYLWILSFATLSIALDGIFVKNIEECPPLTPRSVATNVHDLRPDDIKVIGALGDSFTAALFANSQVGDVNFFEEYRGHSLYIGGDNGAESIANFIQHFQPKLIGSSKGHHAVQFCTYTPELDQLNAAQTGAAASNLGTQLDYLIETMMEMDFDFENDWKMITIEIGGNDQCNTCKAFEENTLGEPENYGMFLEQAIDRIYESIPKVLVNLGASFSAAGMIKAKSSRTGYCNKPNSPISNIISCPCGATDEGLSQMIKNMKAYDKIILGIYNKYQRIQDDQFALILHGTNIDSRSSPDQFWSDLDCFHPSLLGQAFSARTIWNQLFKPFSDKTMTIHFNAEQLIYCPADSDRIITV